MTVNVVRENEPRGTDSTQKSMAHGRGAVSSKETMCKYLGWPAQYVEGPI